MARKIEARPLRPSERERALDHLARNPRQNLYLLDLTARFGVPQAVGELPIEIVSAWRNGVVVGVVALRPSVVFDSAVSEDVLAAFFPFLEPLRVGLVKSSTPIVDLLWDRLSRRRRHRLGDTEWRRANSRSRRQSCAPASPSRPRFGGAVETGASARQAQR